MYLENLLVLQFFVNAEALNSIHTYKTEKSSLIKQRNQFLTGNKIVFFIKNLALDKFIQEIHVS